MPDASRLINAMLNLQPRLRRFAYGLCHSVEDADDLVQATYERAYTRLNQWQVGTRVDSWMYRILHSVYLNNVRRQNTRDRFSSGHDPDTLANPTISTPEQSALFAEIHQHIQALPEDQRAVLILVTVEGLSYAEAATTVGVPVGTVTSRLARARLALAKSLSPDNPIDSMS